MTVKRKLDLMRRTVDGIIDQRVAKRLIERRVNTHEKRSPHHIVITEEMLRQAREQEIQQGEIH